MSREFRQYLQLIARDVSVQDGAAPGGSDFVIFPNYRPEASACVVASYPAEAAASVALASYQADEPAAVTAQYGTGCGAVTFARY